MRIGFYHDGAGAIHAGGIAVYTRWMATKLAESNDVYVYTQSGDLVSELVESGVHVIETPALDRHSLSAITKLLPFGPQDLSKIMMTGWSTHNGVIDHIEEHVDVLFTFQALDDVLLSNMVDTPTIRGFLSDFVDTGVGAAIRERFTRTDFHFANTPYLANRVADEFGYEVDKVIPTGVDTELFTPEAEPAFECDELTILFVGRLVESKGIFDLLEAVARLDDRFHLRIVGAGDEERVSRRSRQLGIADRTTLEGEIPHTDLPGYYTAADVFCLPTYVDSFGTVNLEAMSCATPVVTTDLDGIETYLRPGKDGKVVTPGDQDALVMAFEELLTDIDSRHLLGARARRRARDFTWTRQSERMEQFCKEVLGVDEKQALTRSDLYNR